MSEALWFLAGAGSTVASLVIWSNLRYLSSPERAKAIREVLREAERAHDDRTRGTDQ